MAKALFSLMAALAVGASATLAAAQGPERQPPGAAERGNRPTGPATPGPAPERAGPPQSVPRRQPSERPAARVPQDRDGARKAAEPRIEGSGRSRAAEQGNRERQGASERNRAGEKEPRERRQQRAVEQPDAVERRRQRAAGQEKQNNASEQRQRNAAGRPDPTKDRSGARLVGERAAKHEQVRQERNKLTRDQRQRLREAFPTGPDRLSKVRFRAHVGAYIPRRVELYAVPALVFAIFPYYRDYSYVLIEDTICIVDPATYQIVDVIDEGSYTPGSRLQVAELTLTEGEAALVRNSIPPDFPVARLRLRLALGADIPDHVELYEFAPVVLDSVPRLRDFRFVVTEDQMVIVSPRGRGIVLVLDR